MKVKENTIFLLLLLFISLMSYWFNNNNNNNDKPRQGLKLAKIAYEEAYLWWLLIRVNHDYSMDNAGNGG